MIRNHYMWINLLSTFNYMLTKSYLVIGSVHPLIWKCWIIAFFSYVNPDWIMTGSYIKSSVILHSKKSGICPCLSSKPPVPYSLPRPCLAPCMPQTSRTPRSVSRFSPQSGISTAPYQSVRPRCPCTTWSSAPSWSVSLSPSRRPAGFKRNTDSMLFWA